MQLIDEKDTPKVATPWLQRVAIALTGTLALSGLYHYSSAFSSCHGAIDEGFQTSAVEYLPIRPQSYRHDASTLKFILNDKEFAIDAAHKLSGAVQIETESYDGTPDPSEDMTKWTKFFAFHEYLEKTFPLVYKHLEVETVNKINLLYTWKGSDPSLKPLMLTAHQDVVPVDDLSVGEWTYPPYSGHFDGETVWGRGSQDCKNLLIAELATVELLLSQGFEPRRTVILAFGHDEESFGYGAVHINDTLTERYGPDSMYALVDEGTAVMNMGGEWFAMPGVSEKGHLDIIVTLTMNGGHSSMPPDHTAIGVMAELITVMEANPFVPSLPNENPVLAALETFAHGIPDWPESLRKDVLSARYDPGAKKRVMEWMATEKSMKFLIQTSQAIDIIHGGVKSNALPEFVSMLVNHRIILESTIEETVDRLFSLLNPIAEKYKLGVFYGEESVTDIDVAAGYFNVTLDGPINALPISPSEGPVWDLLAGTIKHVFDDEVLVEEGKKIHIGPILMGANTDTKRYTGLTKNIFRFQAKRMVEANTGIHSIDEHVGIAQHMETVGFLYEYIQNVDEASD